MIRWNLNDSATATIVAKTAKSIYSILYIKERKLLIIGDMDGGLHWIDLVTKQELKATLHHKKGVFGIHQHREYIFTLGGSGQLTKWGIDRRLPIETLHLSSSSLRAFAKHPFRNEIAIGASDNAIYILDSNTLEIKQHIANAHDNSVFSLAYQKVENGRKTDDFSTDDHKQDQGNAQLWSGGRDAHLNIWDADDAYTLLSSQPAHYFTINQIRFNPDFSLAATASRDKTIKIWDAHSFKLLKVIDFARNECHLNSINDLYWTADGKRLVSCSDDRMLMVWEVIS